LILVLVIQLIVIIGIARAASFVSKKLSQPIVVGEIMAGLLLGPSFLGRYFHTAFTSLFPEQTSQYIYVLAQIGMIFLLFVIGLEFDFGKIASHGRRAGMISGFGIALPFGLGLLLGKWMHGYFPTT